MIGWLLRVLYNGLKETILQTKEDLEKRCETIETSLSELQSTLFKNDQELLGHYKHVFTVESENSVF